jgi:hypothetical protein
MVVVVMVMVLPEAERAHDVRGNDRGRVVCLLGHALLGPEGRDGQVVFVVGEGEVGVPDLHGAGEEGGKEGGRDESECMQGQCDIEKTKLLSRRLFPATLTSSHASQLPPLTYRGLYAIAPHSIKALRSLVTSRSGKWGFCCGSFLLG